MIDHSKNLNTSNLLTPEARERVAAVIKGNPHIFEDEDMQTYLVECGMSMAMMLTAAVRDGTTVDRILATDGAMFSSDEVREALSAGLMMTTLLFLDMDDKAAADLGHRTATTVVSTILKVQSMQEAQPPTDTPH